MQTKKAVNESSAIYHQMNWLQFNCITADEIEYLPPSLRRQQRLLHETQDIETEDCGCNRTEAIRWYVFCQFASKSTTFDPVKIIWGNEKS